MAVDATMSETQNDTQPETMRPAYWREYGEPEVLEVGDLPLPKVGPSEVLVKVRGAGVNPVDAKVMAGGLEAMLTPHYPVVPGWDVAGVVESVGPDTPEFQPGDEVIAYNRKDALGGGTWSEYTVVPVRSLARKPATMDWAAAAGLPLVGLTAKRVIEALEVGEGDTILIHGASGGVGRVALQLAAARGARVIGTGSQTNHDRLRELGAEPVSYGDGLLEAVRDLAPQGVSAVADLVGGVWEQTRELLAVQGRHVSIADPSVVENGGRWLWVRPDGAGLAELGELVEAGRLTVDVDRSLALEQAGEAMRAILAGEASGKLVIDVAL